MSSTAPEAWGVQDVCSFLESLSLHTLAPKFKENAVNGSDLVDLTDEDLKEELGCTPLQVKKLRKALAAASSSDVSGISSAVQAPVDSVAYPIVHPAAATECVQPSVMPAALPAESAAAVERLSTTLPPPALATHSTGGTGAGGGFQGKVPAVDVAKLKQLRQELAKVQAPGARLEQQRREVAQLSARASQQPARVAATAAEVQKEQEMVDKYTADGWFPGKIITGKKKAEEHMGLLQQAKAALEAANAEQAAVWQQLAKAKSDLDPLEALEAEAVVLRKEVEDVTARVVAAAVAADPGAAHIKVQLESLAPQHKQAEQHAQAYVGCAQKLQQAMSLLQEAVQSLQKGSQSAPVGMVMAVARPGPAIGRGARAPVPLMAMQNMNMGKAEKQAKAAAELVQAAQGQFPDGNLPYIRPATVKKGMQGILLNMTLGGVASEMAMMRQFQEALQACQAMMSEIQQALSWLTPRASAAQEAAAQLAGQVRSLEQQSTANEQALLSQMLAGA